MNNFKRMQEEDEMRYGELEEKRVKSGIMGTLGFLRFVGQLVDIYLPRVVDMFVATAGGSVGGAKIHRSDPASDSRGTAGRGTFAPAPDDED